MCFPMHLQALLPAVNCICLHISRNFQEAPHVFLLHLFAIIHDNYPVAVRYGFTFAIIITVIPFRFSLKKRVLNPLPCLQHLWSHQHNYLWFFNKDLAIQSLCFCPPESLCRLVQPSGQTFSSLLTKGHAWACFNLRLFLHLWRLHYPISYCLLQFPKIGCSSANHCHGIS